MGIWVFLRDCQPNGILRAVVDTSEAGLAVAGDVHRLPVLHPDRPGWTDHLADSATDTPVRHLDEMLPGVCRHLAGTGQKFLMSRSVGVGHRGNPALPGSYVRRNLL